MKNSFNLSIYSTKRMDISYSKEFFYRVLAVVLAIIFAGLMFAIMGFNPFNLYFSMIKGSLGSVSSIKETVKLSFPMLVSALAVSISFKMRFWNIGGEGQICIAAIVASYFAYFHSYLPQFYLISLMIISSTLAAGLFALIPAYFKTKYNTNETLLTLMLNYIAVYIIQFLREGPWRDPSSLGFPIMPRFPKNARIPLVLGVHFGWIVALLLLILVYLYINHSKHGYELRVVGENKKTAEYAGMPVSKIIMRTMFISGAIAGLAGVFQVAGADKQLTETVAGGVGFTAIIIAWLARLKTPSIFIISILFGILAKGSSTIETMLKIPSSMSRVLQGILLFFVLGSEFFINYSIKFKNKYKELKN